MGRMQHIPPVAVSPTVALSSAVLIKRHKNTCPRPPWHRTPPRRANTAHCLRPPLPPHTPHLSGLRKPDKPRAAAAARARPRAGRGAWAPREPYASQARTSTTVASCTALAASMSCFVIIQQLTPGDVGRLASRPSPAASKAVRVVPNATTALTSKMRGPWNS